MIVVISHERDLLNNVVDHILHLEGGKVMLYPGGYDAFERQRAERLAQQEAARSKQAAEREKLQDYVARNSARASTAKQAQSRAKALAKMQPIAAAMEDPTLTFTFPSPPELRPPLITMDMAAVGYNETPILRRVNLRIDPDDRVALLGRNGNGKTTLARLIAAQLAPMEGEMASSPKMNVGYFTQYQVEELDTEDTPLEHMTRQMKGATQGAVRAQLGRFGFSGIRATQKVGSLSGGERARLALALITRDAPHLLILDEPTNHLDVDSREALVQALNAYQGAVVLVSHDRHMLELVADRLVLVDNGTAQEYNGTIEDYTDFVLGKSGSTAPSGGDAPKADRKAEKRASAEWRERQKTLKNAVNQAERAMAALTADRSRIDAALFDPAKATGAEAKLTTSQLMVKRAEIEKKLEKAEETWMEAGAALEAG
jgi:ATP-binding cassette subfamily F protein 3